CRIFPEIVASTLWPLVSSTRNIALGRASEITPSISMTPSFLAIASLSLLQTGRSAGWVGVAVRRHADTGATHQRSIIRDSGCLGKLQPAYTPWRRRRGIARSVFALTLTLGLGRHSFRGCRRRH